VIFGLLTLQAVNREQKDTHLLWPVPSVRARDRTVVDTMIDLFVAWLGLREKKKRARQPYFEIAPPFQLPVERVVSL
jgi:hypothetical protein